MAKLLSLSIDVTKIDKSRLYKGAKGTYLNITVGVNDDADQFGNQVSCWENQTEEERKAKAQRNFLGNGKVLFSDDHKAKAQEVSNEPSAVDVSGDELPW